MYYIKSRRGVSQVIGSLFALGIVAAFGSILLLQGVQGVENFTSFVKIFDETENKASQEVFIVEHVRFDPNSKQIEIWIRNTGPIEITIDKISIVNIDTQELIVSNGTIAQDIFQKEVKKIALLGSGVTLPTGCTPTWDQCPPNHVYRITVSTIRDKSIEFVAGLFNT